MFVGIKPEGAPEAPKEVIIGLDWSLRLLVDGQQKTTARPLSFPLKVGDSWTSDWTDPRQMGVQTSARFRNTYKVIGWDDVTVPGGTFHALKIEVQGVGDFQVVVPAVAQSTATAGAGAGTATSHVQAGGKGVVHITTFSDIWYAPEVKHSVKIVDEQYDVSNVMIKRDTEELVSFNPAP
jgi:hypothetical protein